MVSKQKRDRALDTKPYLSFITFHPIRLVGFSRGAGHDLVLTPPCYLRTRKTLTTGSVPFYPVTYSPALWLAPRQPINYLSIDKNYVFGTTPASICTSNNCVWLMFANTLGSTDGVYLCASTSWCKVDFGR